MGCVCLAWHQKFLPVAHLDSSWPKLRHLRRRRARDNPRFFHIRAKHAFYIMARGQRGECGVPFLALDQPMAKSVLANYVTGIDLAHGRMRYEMDVRAS